MIYALNGSDMSPEAGPLIVDAAGNLYGASKRGGANGSCEYGCGEVFELSPPAAGQSAWTRTVLQTFGGTNGYYPIGAMVADAAGDIYGTTLGGGTNDDGVVFELTPPTTGANWTETVLQAFDGTNGANPWGGLIADAAGNLYGAAAGGGANGEGLVFELSPPQARNAAWTETVLQSFSGANGATPYGTLLADGSGDLYGTTFMGGRDGDGVVFELIPPRMKKTGWREAVIHSFCAEIDCKDGGLPSGGLIADGAGNLYGTTPDGGAHDDGVAFSLTP